jgi:hypothetical protein
MLQCLRRWLTRSLPAHGRKGERSRAFKRLGCEPLESRCLLSAATLAYDDASSQRFLVAALQSPALIGAPRVANTSKEVGNYQDLSLDRSAPVKPKPRPPSGRSTIHSMHSARPFSF